MYVARHPELICVVDEPEWVTTSLQTPPTLILIH